MTPRHTPTPTARHLGGAWRRRLGSLAISAAVLAALAALLWHLLSGTASTKREVAAVPMLVLPPPPPPPPQPEELPEPEPEPVEPDVTEPDPIEPLEVAEEEAPNPSEDMSDPVTIDGPAQAGADAFGVQAGGGSGMTGGSKAVVGASYARYVSGILQQALARDRRTRRLVFDDIRIDLWLDAMGKPVRVQLVNGSGNERIDSAVLAMLREIDSIGAEPPASLQFPMRVAMTGRRP
ncbi:MAG: hypothetical protein DIU74_011310 [Pseudomonadota bacterium]